MCSPSQIEMNTIIGSKSKHLRDVMLYCINNKFSYNAIAILMKTRMLKEERRRGGEVANRLTNFFFFKCNRMQEAPTVRCSPYGSRKTLALLKRRES